MLLAACGGDSTAPTNEDLDAQETLDVAEFAADAIVEDVSLMNAQEGALGQPVVHAGRIGGWHPCGGAFDPQTGRIACQAAHHGQLTITRSITFRDASGQPQPAYDAQTTASANFVSTITGSMAHHRFTASYSRQRDITVSGLLGAETTHIFDGVGSTSVTESRHTGSGAARSYAMTGTTTISGVVVPVPRTDTGWPTAGTITHQVAFHRHGARGGGRSGTRTVTITFNGTRFVPLVVNGHELTLDLATGRIVDE
jgi:hypothetical protein